ncbi:hypothetical protein D6745_03400 [Candidatus Woesearchaeota archaeon]|nr:MAG: hypothetical protein D6745_03400 [Candidatus Woesearchaeota archaeon]
MFKIKQIYILVFLLSFVAVSATTVSHDSESVDFGKVFFQTQENYNNQNPQITNDGGTYNALLIAGKGASPDRSVKVWDDLTVSDTLVVYGLMYQGGTGLGNRVCRKDRTNCPACSGSDTQCDVSGLCSQVCIGTDCRSSWPTSESCGSAGVCSQVCIGSNCRTTWPKKGVNKYKLICQADANQQCSATCASNYALTDFNPSGSYLKYNNYGNGFNVVCETNFACGGSGTCTKYS